MPSGFDPMGGYRFSEKITLHQRSKTAMTFKPKAIALWTASPTSRVLWLHS
jgi:hypothetical protein